MERIEDYPLKQKSTDSFARAEGKFRLLAWRRADIYRTYILGDFDSPDAARVRAKELCDPLWTFSVFDRWGPVKGYGDLFPLPKPKQSLNWKTAKPISVTRLCGQKGRSSFDSRGEYKK